VNSLMMVIIIIGSPSISEELAANLKRDREMGRIEGRLRTEELGDLHT
jgi:hypothetical protein